MTNEQIAKEYNDSSAQNLSEFCDFIKGKLRLEYPDYSEEQLEKLTLVFTLYLAVQMVTSAFNGYRKFIDAN